MGTCGVCGCHSPLLPPRVAVQHAEAGAAPAGRWGGARQAGLRGRAPPRAEGTLPVAGHWQQRPEQPLRGATFPPSLSTPLAWEARRASSARRGCPLHSQSHVPRGPAGGWVDGQVCPAGRIQAACAGRVQREVRCADQHPHLGLRPPSALPPLTSHGWGHGPGTAGSSEGLRLPRTCPGHLATYTRLGKGVSGGLGAANAGPRAPAPRAASGLSPGPSRARPPRPAAPPRPSARPFFPVLLRLPARRCLPLPLGPVGRTRPLPPRLLAQRSRRSPGRSLVTTCPTIPGAASWHRVPVPAWRLSALVFLQLPEPWEGRGLRCGQTLPVSCPRTVGTTVLRGVSLSRQRLGFVWWAALGQRGVHPLGQCLAAPGVGAVSPGPAASAPDTSVPGPQKDQAARGPLARMRTRLDEEACDPTSAASQLQWLRGHPPPPPRPR